MIALDNGDKIQGDTTTVSKVDYTIDGVVGTTITQLANGQLPSSTGDLYTSSADETVIASIRLVNTNTSAESVNLYLTPSGGTARRIIPKDLSLGVDYSLEYDGKDIKVYDDEGNALYGLSFNYLDLPEIAEPGNPTTNNLRLFVLEDNGFSVLSFKDDGGMVRQFMRDSVFIGYNDTGSTIAANRIVYAAGSTGTVPKIALAKADSSSTMPAIGVTIDSTANGAYGRVMQIGLLEDVNTSAYSAGNILYVSAATAGVPTATAPSYPNIRQEIGTVLVDNATTGAIQIVARSAFDDAVVLESAVAFAFLLGG